MRSSRRSPVGARASRRLLRWPARNYFADLQPRLEEAHPVDDALGSDPALLRLRRRARRFLGRLQARAPSSDLLDFETARNHFDEARVEAAYNLGFEAGLIAGRAEGLRRSAGPARDAAERALLANLRSALEKNRPSPERTQAVLQELAWSFAVGSGLPRRSRAR